MSAIQVIQTVIDILLLIAVVLSMVYEPLLIKWEDKQQEKLRKAFNKRKEYRK